ncbi:MAG: type II toxin-antitoxin system HipA family toxin YjjJ [Ramlibacter sp.]
MADAHAADLLQRLRAAGAATSKELQAATGSSQPTVSRALAPLLTRGEALRVGRGRNQAYVVPRPVTGVDSPSIPVLKVDADGHSSNFGTLIPTTGGRFWMEEEQGPSRLHGGLPWFIADMRPQGFLGRSFAHAHAKLGFTANPAQWTDDDVLRALCNAGDDLPGNLIIGNTSFERFMHATAQQRVAPPEYSQLADAAMQGALPGSSAGGDQPKFCAVRKDGKSVIVKFSPASTSEVDVRWADLLVCEHIALDVLLQSGIPAARSRIFQGQGRMLLEVERFDRTARGRIGMVSLLSYDSEYVGKIDNWAAAAGRMLSRGLMTAEDAQRLCLLEAFGQLIANTDRHYGNVSLLIGDNGKWQLAPAYDMLPMLYAPLAGELVMREFNPAALAPTPDTLRAWSTAQALARRFWQTVAKDSRLSDAFRRVAAEHSKRLAA